MNIDTETKLCAVIGNPVGHSLSPAIHNAAFQALDLNYVYVAFQVERLDDCLTGMRALPSFRGMSVTIPHKLAVIPLLDEIDPLAAHVGSVNTITHEGGRLIGSNTDGLGTLRAFSEAAVALAGRRVLFLGTGGAVRAVAFAVAEEAGADGVTILGRTPTKARQLVEDLRPNTTASLHAGDLATELEAALATHDVIIQGTPVGMHPHTVGQSCVPGTLLRKEHAVFDMVYRPLRTQLILDAEAAGCKTILGTEMLLHQAALQFERWTGVEAPIKAMRAALMRAIGADEPGPALRTADALQEHQR